MEDQSPRGKKVKRSMPLIDEKGKREYRAKKFESQNRYNVLRSPPQIVEIIKKAIRQNLDEDF